MNPIKTDYKTDAMNAKTKIYVLTVKRQQTIKILSTVLSAIPKIIVTLENVLDAKMISTKNINIVLIVIKTLYQVFKGILKKGLKISHLI